MHAQDDAGWHRACPRLPWLGPAPARELDVTCDPSQHPVSDPRSEFPPEPVYDPLELHRTTEGLPDYPYDPNTLLSNQDAAVMLGVRAATLVKWRKKGLGPPVTNLTGRPKGFRYRYGDLVAFIWHMRRLLHAPPNLDAAARRNWTLTKVPRPKTVILKVPKASRERTWTGKSRRRHMARPGLHWRIADIIANAGGGLSAAKIAERLLTDGWTSRGISFRDIGRMQRGPWLFPDWFAPPDKPDGNWTLTTKALKCLAAEPPPMTPEEVTAEVARHKKAWADAAQARKKAQQATKTANTLSSDQKRDTAAGGKAALTEKQNETERLFQQLFLPPIPNRPVAGARLEKPLQPLRIYSATPSTETFLYRPVASPDGQNQPY